MSNLKYAIIEEEVVVSTADSPAAQPPRKPYIIAKLGERFENVLTRRVEAALDKDFAHGSMPA